MSYHRLLLEWASTKNPTWHGVLVQSSHLHDLIKMQFVLNTSNCLGKVLCFPLTFLYLLKESDFSYSKFWNFSFRSICWERAKKNTTSTRFDLAKIKFKWVFYLGFYWNGKTYRVCYFCNQSTKPIDATISNKTMGNY